MRGGEKKTKTKDDAYCNVNKPVLLFTARYATINFYLSGREKYFRGMNCNVDLKILTKGENTCI